MKLYLRPRLALVCAVLFLCCCRLSYWQYTRHEEKKVYIATLQERLAQPVVPLTNILKEIPRSPAHWQNLLHRRVSVSGTWENKFEVVLRNRRLENDPGAFVITPLKLEDSDQRILVSRGFIPLSLIEREARAQFHVHDPVSFVGLIKESSRQEFLAPNDPPAGPGLPWADRWLRVDIPRMQPQLPFPVLPIFLEVMDTLDPTNAATQITSPKDGRAEMISIPSAESKVGTRLTANSRKYPVPVFDTVIPPGRHFGYIFEWLFIGVLVLVMGVLVMRNPLPEK